MPSPTAVTGVALPPATDTPPSVASAATNGTNEDRRIGELRLPAGRLPEVLRERAPCLLGVPVVDLTDREAGPGEVVHPSLQVEGYVAEVRAPGAEARATAE